MYKLHQRANSPKKAHWCFLLFNLVNRTNEAIKITSIFYLQSMEANQIVRIPIKYWELFDTMSNEESWKLIKALMTWKNDLLNGLTLTYYNIIYVDIINLFNSANNWKKGGRPKNKPVVIEKENLGLWKTITNTSKDNIKESNISKDNINKQYFSNEKINNIFLDFIQHRKEIKKPITKTWINQNIKKINNWLLKYDELEIIWFIENSISNGYQWIFEKETDNKKATFKL